jgi:hypothetical protein|tara:strand:- start:358 stop:546 length:189 start_codon:yes stop_codon:yes gene_type:complete
MLRWALLLLILFNLSTAIDLSTFKQQVAANLLTSQTANPKDQSKCDRIFNQYLLKCTGPEQR